MAGIKTRVKCPKCGQSFDYEFIPGMSLAAARLGPYRYMRCSKCGRLALFDIVGGRLGGHIDRGEGIMEALYREFTEEAALFEKKTGAEVGAKDEQGRTALTKVVLLDGTRAIKMPVTTNADPTFCASGNTANPFNRPRFWRKKIVDNIKLMPKIRFNGKGFICALITSRCPVGCEHCMFFSNMAEAKSPVNTMTPYRISNLMKLVHDSNTGYLLISGGGEGFLEPALMNRIIQETTANVTWMVTSAYWAGDKNRAREVVHDMYDAFIRGEHKEHGRRICVRVSFDTFHINTR